MVPFLMQKEKDEKDEKEKKDEKTVLHSLALAGSVDFQLRKDE